MALPTDSNKSQVADENDTNSIKHCYFYSFLRIFHQKAFSILVPYSQSTDSNYAHGQPHTFLIVIMLLIPYATHIQL